MNGQAKPQISLIIVSLNVRDLLRKNLDSIFSTDSACTFEVIVIDNGSEDKTARMVREDFPQVHLIQNDYNSGFAHACNQGLAVAQGDVLVLYNPDMLMGDGVLDHTWNTLTSRSEIGVLGVQLRKEDGSLVRSVRRDPGLQDQLAVLLKLPHLFPNVVKQYLAEDIDQRVSQEVEQLRGSYFAFRRDVMEKIGVLDEKNFFVWFEEVDFCKRVRAAGLKVWFSAEVFCTDLVGQTFKTQPTALKQARFSKSLANYFKKWHPRWQSVVITILRPLAIAAGYAHDLWRR